MAKSIPSAGTYSRNLDPKIEQRFAGCFQGADVDSPFEEEPVVV